MTFHPLTLFDREAMQAVTLPSGRRNCNYTFANLVGWKFLFGTELCVLENAVVLRYTFDGRRAYMVCTSEALSSALIEALFDDSNGDLTLMGLEDSQVGQLPNLKAPLSSPRQGGSPDAKTYLPQSGEVRRGLSIKPVRNQYDYIYRRTDLATLRGRHLDAKRNHINRFRAEHPDFEYRTLTPELFDECRRLTEIWQEEKNQSQNRNETIVNHARIESQLRFHLYSCAVSPQDSSILATLGCKGVLPRRGLCVLQIGYLVLWQRTLH